MDARYTDLAMDIVPLGRRPMVVDLRTQIAHAIEVEVKMALVQQEREALPEKVRLLELETQRRAKEHVDQVRRDAAAHQENVTKLEQERIAFRAIVAGHCELLKAVEAWLEWCEGHGDIEERATRWCRVKAAMTKYRSLNTPK